MQELEILQGFEETRGGFRLPLDMKPCICMLMKDYKRSKDGINAFIIACELFRVGKTKVKLESVLFELGVRYSKMRSVVKSALTGRYNYGCPRLEGEGLCLYQNRTGCWWYQRIPKKGEKRWKERDFWRFGWPTKLTPALVVVYLAIRELEHKRGYKAGSRLYVPRKELAELTGISAPWAIKSLEKLEESRLIKFQKGKQHRWYGKASEVQRIIPIPKPQMQCSVDDIARL